MAIDKKNLWIPAAALLVAAAGLYWYAQTIRPMPSKQILIDSTALSVEVAKTPASREQGLSGRTALAEGQGMLFVFDEDGAWGIWMKDMLFSIDIMWADAEGRVVTIVRNAAPESYPTAFYPTAPARYVVEVPAGYADRHGLAEGSKIVI